MTDSPALIPIEVAYATPEHQKILEMQVAPGTKARDAVLLSSIDRYFDGVDKQHDDIGVFGKLVDDDYELLPGDRIEIYRPLKADPKEVRRRRAAQGKSMKKGV